MHTFPAHVALALPLCKLFFPEDLALQGAVIAGSVIPDIPIIAFGIKKWRSKDDELPSGRKTSLSHHILHSFIIWFGLALLSVGLLHFMGRSAASMPLYLPALALGGMEHVIVDIISHKKLKGRESWFEIVLTKTYVWPFYCELKSLKLFDYRGWLLKRCRKKSHRKSWLNLVTIREIVISIICVGLYAMLCFLL